MMAHRALILFVVALVARVVAAASSAMYVDEAFGFFMSRHDFMSIIVGSRPDNNPPLWYFLMHPLALAVSQGSTSAVVLLRLPSCIFGALAAPVTYWIGRRWGERVGLAAGALMALSYTSWLVDAQTRAYGLVTLLATLGLWMTLRLTDEGRVPGGLAALAAVAVGLPLFHYIGWLIDFALLLACAVRREWRGAACFALGIVVGAGWMVYAFTNPQSGLHARTLASSGLSEAALLVGFLSGAAMPLHWGALRGMELGAVSYGVGLAALAWAAWGAYGVLREDVRGGVTLLLFIGVPICGIAAGALGGLQPYQNRYLVPLSAGFFLLLARLPWGVLGLVVVNAITLLMFPTDAYLWNQDWASAARWIERREGRGDVIAAYTPYSLVGLDFYYHAGQATVDFSTPGAMNHRFAEGYDGAEVIPIVPPMLTDELAARIAHRSVFLVFNQGDPAAANAISEWFNARYSVADAYVTRGLMSWGNITIYQLRPR